MTWSLHAPTLLSGIFLLVVGVAAPLMAIWRGLDPLQPSAVLIVMVLGLLILASCLNLIDAGLLIVQLVRRLRDLARKDTLTGLYHWRAAQATDEDAAFDDLLIRADRTLRRQDRRAQPGLVAEIVVVEIGSLSTA
jgi:hypothetical protein